MTQPDLFDQPVLSRRKDPETSKGAARSMEGVASDHKRLVYRAMALSYQPLSFQEIAKLMNHLLSEEQVRKRVGDLHRAGLVVDSGERTRNKSGRLAIRWRVSLPGEPTTYTAPNECARCRELERKIEDLISHGV